MMQEWELAVSIAADERSRFYMGGSKACPKNLRDARLIETVREGLTLAGCKRKCDEVGSCAAFDYQRSTIGDRNNNQRSICYLLNDRCPMLPGNCEWSKSPCHFWHEHVLTTECARDMPWSDPYWYEISDEKKPRVNASVVGKITNRQRFES